MRNVSTIGDFQTRAWERAGRSTAMPLGRDAREEPDAKVGIVAKLMAEDAEGTWGITKSAGGLDRGKLLDEEGTQGFVLPLEMRFGGEEEGGIAGVVSTDLVLIAVIDGYHLLQRSSWIS